MTNLGKKVLKWTLLYPLVVFVCLEIAFRIMGYSAYHNADYTILSTPKNAFIGHPEYGIQLDPGKFTILLNERVEFETTHLPNHIRYTPGSSAEKGPTVAMLGCSFTYGYGVNDDETFTAILQEHLPEFRFLNFGVPGYGTVQASMQLRTLLSAQQVETVVLHFSSMHFMRNVLSQQYRSNLKIGYQRSSKDVDAGMRVARFPYKKECNDPIRYEGWESMYTNWPGRSWLASVNAFQTFYDRTVDPEKEIEITACLIEEMAALCAEKEVRFIVACLDKTPETENLKKLVTVEWLDINFDFSSKKLTHLPHDSHPNSQGHALIAQRLENYLKQPVNAK
ncbi:MAG: hypothetical protein N4A41_03220 [Crocinitomicaceae bacterium]|jgi:hypothetical protein|nr:hypothetical protein [Crocinitomicaceae bacterium]